MTALDPNLAGAVLAELPGALFLSVSGAHLYGFPSADSDVDVRGCFLTPLREVVGLEPPEETREREFVFGGTEVEVVAHEAAKYLRLLGRHNGYILEQIFSPLVLHGADYLAGLRPLARRCVTRGCHRHYRGFLQTQLKQIEQADPPRIKSVLYAYRVVLTGIHLLETGEVEAHLPTLAARYGLRDVDELIERKKAAEFGPAEGLDWPTHRAELESWERRLDQAHTGSHLPDDPPRDDLNEFLLRLRFGRR